MDATPKSFFSTLICPLWAEERLLSSIQQNPAYSYICIVMLSTTQNASEIAEYTRMGIDFVIKPNLYNELVSLIKAYLIKTGVNQRII
jgi:hypothetical protein